MGICSPTLQVHRDIDREHVYDVDAARDHSDPRDLAPSALGLWEREGDRNCDIGERDPPEALLDDVTEMRAVDHAQPTEELCDAQRDDDQPREVSERSSPSVLVELINKELHLHREGDLCDRCCAPPEDHT